MNIDLADTRGFPHIKLSGEVDLYNAGSLKKVIEQLIGESKVRLIIDLEKVSYIDSSGLGVFISSLKKLGQHDGSIKFVHVSDSIINLFEVTNLTAYLDIYGTPEEAASAFSPESSH